MSRNSKVSKSDKRKGGVVRVGIGYDVHEFGRKRRFMLGGVRIPNLVGLVGHSDADVLLHALCDALLGAAGLGDIGKQFPDTSSKYKNISSMRLLVTVAGLLKRHRLAVGNIDSTVILQRPKIAQYVPAMQAKIAKALNLPTSRVSIKATTNEGLGFIGRGEGCASIAIAVVMEEGR